MPAECRSVLKACLAQFTLLDVCGNPATGAASKLTTKGFITVTATAQIEDGEEFTLKNACGDFCVDERDDDLFRRYDIEAEFCEIDAEGLTLIANARALVDGSAVTKGFAVGRTTVGSNPFSLELWAKVAGQACAVDGTPEWYYFAFPHMANGVLTDLTFENGPLTLSIRTHTKDAGPLWGRGPALVLPVSAPAISTDHLLGYITTVQPPAVACGLHA